MNINLKERYALYQDLISREEKEDKDVKHLGQLSRKNPKMESAKKISAG